MKIGRNERCPCGSGKKYKRCCLGRGASTAKTPAALAARQMSAPFPSPSVEAPGPGSSAEEIVEGMPSGMQLSPYTVAKMAEERSVQGFADRRLKEMLQHHWKHGWTIARVAKMTTDAITAQLADYGVTLEREVFVKQAQELSSAWSFVALWKEEHSVRCRGKEEDFLGLAACELWKRWCPEPPSMEMLDDWMQDGYALLEEGNRVEACSIWWKTWQEFHRRFAPAMTTIESTSSVFCGYQSLFNWCQEFEQQVLGLANDPEWAAISKSYCEQLLAQFPDEHDSIQTNFRRALAELLLREGRGEEGLATLREVVGRWPEDPWGYISLADAYAHLLYDAPFPRDVAKANGWLDRALGEAHLDKYDRDAIEERRESYAEPPPDRSRRSRQVAKPV